MTTGSPTSKPANRERKPWVSPRVTSGRLFESNSLSCNKLPGEEPNCQEQPPVTSS